MTRKLLVLSALVGMPAFFTGFYSRQIEGIISPYLPTPVIMLFILLGAVLLYPWFLFFTARMAPPPVVKVPVGKGFYHN